MNTTTAETPLSPEDFGRLVALLEHHGSLLALHRATGIPYHELFAWRQRPHIDQAVRDAVGYEEGATVANSVKDLTRLRDSCEDPVERRRLNTAILRALNPPPRRRSTTPAPDRPGPRPTTPEPGRDQSARANHARSAPANRAVPAAAPLSGGPEGRRAVARVRGDAPASQAPGKPAEFHPARRADEVGTAPSARAGPDAAFVPPLTPAAHPGAA